MLSGYINEVNEDGAEISSSTQIKLYYRPFQTLHLLPWQMNMPRPLAAITRCQQNLHSLNTYFSILKEIMKPTLKIIADVLQKMGN